MNRVFALLSAVICTVAALSTGTVASTHGNDDSEICAYTAVAGCEYAFDAPALVFVSSVLVGAGVPVEFCKERDGVENCGGICVPGLVMGDVTWLRIGGQVPSAADVDCHHVAGFASIDAN